ncbi:efflux transporter outer membrane subunit [Altererythrobacter xixiisoli]|uniref:Efflux transporter outer membrane subunit n=1 Tax=Croceibacterium xixiisoli TaxID=1476466 RepID=A0A6I4TVL4_9SPHN|nr:efflux transporter outer membrane subunit [Croceibacterium xixiisoli]MXP00107.1 efflux transporter outer membrane subunit [Croceibacterium xixiisoli]
MKRQVTATLTLAAMLAGCTNLAPEHVRPDLSTAPAFPADYRPDGTLVASKLGWRDFFVDPRLQKLIETALANNRDLMAATARIDQARAQYRIADSRRLPSLDANAGYTSSRSNMIGQVFTMDRYEVGVAVSSFELDFWGRVANQSESARASYLASEANQKAFYLSLIGDVANTYLEMIETDEQIALAEATAESRREELRIAKLRLDAGVTSGLPFNQAETLLTQAEQQLAAFRLTAAQLNNQLTVLVGGEIPTGLPPGLALRAQDDGRYLGAGLPSDLLLNRPDIVAAEESLRGARADIGAARAAFFPTISLTGSTGLVSMALSSLFSGDSWTWSYGGSASLPIFDNGARQGDLGVARGREAELIATYDKTVQTAFREVADALAGRRWLGEQIEAQLRNQEAQQKIAQIARVRYREGVADYLEVLDAERNLFAARQSILTTGRAIRQNAVTLYIAVGGGAQERTEAAAGTAAPVSAATAASNPARP